MSIQLIEFKNVSLRLRDKYIFKNISWSIQKSEHWAVIGPNGAGKSILAKSLLGEVPVVSGDLDFHSLKPEEIGYVSFELQQQVLDAETRAYQSVTFSGDFSKLTKTRDLILAEAAFKNIPIKEQGLRLKKAARQLGISHLLNREIVALSDGEMRKALIARALIPKPRLVILDEPFEGLDARSRAGFTRTLNSLIKHKLQIVFITHRFNLLLPGITHVMLVDQCRIKQLGRRRLVLTKKNLARVFNKPVRPDSLKPDPAPAPKPGKPIIDIRNAVVKFGRIIVLNNINWTVRKGEHWLLAGPNGAGKSTLLEIITSDQLQVYANDVTLFGKKRGSGDTIWEIRRRLGIMSSEFQLVYRKNITSLEVVLSGWFDSVGMYHTATGYQKAQAKNLMRTVGIGRLAGSVFTQLSYGERRLVLVARALVKSPEVLLLDEPCMGLDAVNRQRIINLVDRVARTTRTQVIFTTHFHKEIPACITYGLFLDRGEVVQSGVLNKNTVV